ncbi:MAG: hypothetical protein WC046_07595 [Candidatus Bathyarchaeia archaeon]
MPFCRKCGRRLAKYSEKCTDCGTSTTAPLINIKRTLSSRLGRSTGNEKIAKAIIPEESPIEIKVISDKPTRSSLSTKHLATPKMVVTVQTLTPTKAGTPVRVVTPVKPTISAKHFIKPKKAKQNKPTAPFTIANARPVAGYTITKSQPVTHPQPVIAQPVIAQPKPTSIVAPVAALKSVIQIKPVTSDKPVIQPKPITPAPVYPPHEIIKSKVSLKADILANPYDYETQTFDFDLKCPNKHFWPEGKALPVSKGVAYCLKCGERLRKLVPKKRRGLRRATTF